MNTSLLLITKTFDVLLTTPLESVECAEDGSETEGSGARWPGGDS